MDGGLAVKAERRSCARLFLKPVGIIEGKVGHVEQIEAETRRGMDHPRAGIKQSLPGFGCAQIRGHVDRTKQ